MRSSNFTPPSSDYWKLVSEVIKERRSVRSFSERRIKYNDLIELVELGVHAPSGSNAQSQRFLIVNDPDEISAIGRTRWVWPYKGNKNRLKHAKPEGIIGRAYALIIVYVDSRLTNKGVSKEYYIWEELEIQNASASIQNILLGATAKGIGSCWISFNEKMNYTRMLSNKRYQNILEDNAIPYYYKPQGIVALGYPAHVGEKGFPVGEQWHGSQLKPVIRSSVESYIIEQSLKGQPPSLNWTIRAYLRSISFLTKILLKIVRKLQNYTSKIENSFF